MKDRITVVIKVANNEKLLKRSMDALLAQSLNFEENTGVLLYADDSVEEKQITVCQSYVSKYPQNVVLQRKLDLTVRETAYYNCIQEGQHWSTKGLEVAVEAGEGMLESTAVIVECYETRDYVTVNHKAITLAVANFSEKMPLELGKYIIPACHRSLIEEAFLAQNTMELSKVLMKILFTSKELSIFQQEKLYGRQTQYPKKNAQYYMQELPEFVAKMQEAKKQEPALANNYDFFAMFQLADAMKTDLRDILNQQEMSRFQEWLKDILKDMKDYILIKGRMNGASRRYALELLYGEDAGTQLVCRGGRLLYQNIVVYNLNQSKSFVPKGGCEIKRGETFAVIAKHPISHGDLVPFLMADSGECYEFISTDHILSENYCVDQPMICEREYQCTLPGEAPLGIYYLMYRYQNLYEGPVFMEQEIRLRR